VKKGSSGAIEAQEHEIEVRLRDALRQHHLVGLAAVEVLLARIQFFARFMESAALWNVDAIEAGPGAEPGFNRFP